MEKLKYFFVLLAVVLVATGATYFGRSFYNKIYVPEISFENNKHEFDTLLTQEDAEIYFKYKNVGTEDLEILNIQTTCGCTIPEWNSKLLAPDEADSFKVSYNIENKGNFLKEIMVYSNSKTSPDHLIISGFVPFE